jgi:hypothetical protein
LLGCERFGCGLRWHSVEGSEAKRQKLSSPAIGKESEVADADEAFG